MGNDHTTQPHESDDRAFRFRSGAVVRAGWLAGDLPFLTRSLRFLLRAPADDLRAEFGLDAGDVGVLAVVDTNPGVTQNDLAASLVKRSDQAMYAAKETGRNRAYFHDGVTSQPVGDSPARLSAASRSGVPAHLESVCDGLRERLIEVTRK